MRFTLFPVLLAAGCLTAADSPKGGEAAKADLKARAEKYLQAASPGVFFSEEKDAKDGRIERVFIVGVSAISTVLGAEEGLDIARERAEESAKTEFVKWLGSKVSVRKSVTNETLLTIEGEESDAGAKTKEFGKRVERRTKEFEETASHLVRGFKPVASFQNGKEKKLVIVYRWDNGVTPAVAKPAEPKAPAKKSVPLIPDRKVIIDE